MNDAAVNAAARHLAAGGLVALPTETVYGLAARADDDSACARIFAAKGRPADHPLIVHVTDAAAAQAFAATWPDSAARLAAAFWPGPLTVIVPRRAGVAQAAAGGLPTVGLRCPAHPMAQALLAAAAQLGVPGVAAPSANRFGRISPTTAAHVHHEFPAEVARGELVVLDGGPSDVGIESAIVDCSGAQPALLRPGQLGAAALAAALGQPLVAAGPGAAKAPGTLASHYAPRARLHLMTTAALAQALRGAPQPGVAVYCRTALVAAPGWAIQPMPLEADAAARALFAALRVLDGQGVDQIWVEAPPAQPAWDGVRDRLRRAASLSLES